MSDIFISYAKEDRPRIETFARALADHGWTVFWDRVIPAGKTWREVIGAELENAECVVVAWSKASIKSHWVQEEADIGLRKGILIPVLIEDVLPPLGFQTIQAADLSKWDGETSSAIFKNLVNDIENIVPSAPPVKPWQDDDITMMTGGGPDIHFPPETETVHKKDHDSGGGSQIKKLTVDSIKMMPGLLSIAVAAYAAFTILSLTRKGEDRVAGYLFSANACILFFGNVFSILGILRASIVCGVGASIQMAILVGMLLLNIGDAIVTVPVNVGISLAFVGMMLFYARKERAQKQTDGPPQGTA